MSAISRTKSQPRQPRRWRARNGLIVATAEAMAEALETIPEGMPWAWAALRVIPVVKGVRIQVMDDLELEQLGFRPLSSLPTVHLPPGIDVSFSVEVEVVGISIDQEKLDQWDMTVDQLVAPAMGNLRRIVGTWRGKVYEDDYDGVPLRMLDRWPYWASSLVLLPDELQRIFGPEDQLFIAPFACNLISLPIDVDRDFAADIVDVYGTVNPRSLLLGMPAFALRDGQLSVEELPGWPEFPEDDDWLASAALDDPLTHHRR